MTVPRYCFNGTDACLTLVKDKMADVIDDMTSHYPRYLNQGNAKSFVEDIASEYCRGRGIDIGAGRFPFQDAIPVDNGTQINANNLKRFVDKSVDYVFSSHCLEHLDAWKEALRESIRVLKKGGILFLYLPHESMVQWHPNSPRSAPIIGGYPYGSAFRTILCITGWLSWISILGQTVIFRSGEFSGNREARMSTGRNTALQWRLRLLQSLDQSKKQSS